MIKVRFDSIRHSQINETHVLVLFKEVLGERFLPIWVLNQDGARLGSSLKREEAFTDTYVLISKLIKIGKIKIDHVCIYDLDEVGIYAKMIVSSRGLFGNDEELHCSLVDGLNIAARTNTPVFVLDSLMERIGICEQEYLGDVDVYYGSLDSGLDEIVPQKGRYGGEFIYASTNMVMAVASLSTTGGIFTCSVRWNEQAGKPFICERVKDAIDMRYASVTGSIYVLPGYYFSDTESERTASSMITAPTDEISIVDAKKYLLAAAEKGDLLIHYYPEKPDDIPEDDEDLVNAAVAIYKDSGEEALDLVKEYQPDLLQRVLKAIEKS